MRQMDPFAANTGAPRGRTDSHCAPPSSRDERPTQHPTHQPSAVDRLEPFVSLESGQSVPPATHSQVGAPVGLTTGVKLRGPERSEGHVSFNIRVRRRLPPALSESLSYWHGMTGKEFVEFQVPAARLSQNQETSHRLHIEDIVGT